MPRKYFFISSVTLLALSISSYYGLVLNIEDGVTRYFWAISMKNLIYAIFFITLASGLILYLDNSYYMKWKNRFLSWFIPVSLILIISGSTGSSYTWPGRDSFIVFFGTILVITTLVFALVQKFRYKK